jgi:hypothetical protein
MASLTKRSTVYFQTLTHQTLKLKTASTPVSISELIDEAARLLINEDQAALSERDNEKEINHEALLNDLKKHGKI